MCQSSGMSTCELLFQLSDMSTCELLFQSSDMSTCELLFQSSYNTAQCVGLVQIRNNQHLNNHSIIYFFKFQQN